YAVLLHVLDRYPGIVKLILRDVEIASEKTDVEGKDSGRLFTEKEFTDGVRAVVRYHDEMLEKDLDERNVFAERVRHPTLVDQSLRRFQSYARQFNEAVQTIWQETVGKRLEATLSTFRGGAQLQQLAEAQVEEATGVQARDVRTEKERKAEGSSYRLLIDRLIGTRVIAALDYSGVERDYECTLADYTRGYYHLLDIDFEELWIVDPNKEMKHWRGNDHMGEYWGPEEVFWQGNDKALRVSLGDDGDTYTIESRAPYPITFRHAHYRSGHKIHGKAMEDENRNNINIVIEPYGTLVWKAQFHHSHAGRDLAGGVLNEVWYHIPRRPRYYRTVQLHFQAKRMADAVIPYDANVIQYRAEKLDADVVPLDSLADALWRTSTRIVVTDEEGEPIRGLHSNSGYITNLGKDRIDVREVRDHYARRWEAERSVERWDDKMRPVRWTYRYRLAGFFTKARVAAAQIALIRAHHDETRLAPPRRPVLYFPFVRRRRDWTGAPPTQKMPIRVGVLQGRAYDEELRQLGEIERVGDHRLLFRGVDPQTMPYLDKSEILWIGYGADLQRRRGLHRRSETAIRRFAAKGGVVVAFAPNTRPVRGNRLAWVPDPLRVTPDTVSGTMSPTDAGAPLFTAPHQVDLSEFTPAVAWSEWSDRFIPLAMAPTHGPHVGDRAATAMMLPYGEGVYILLGVGPDTADDLQWAMPLAENVLHYAVDWLDRRQTHRHIA
ncbi:hypothetical protein HOI71_24910, partial [Candidatus Poribacteria bacterium]|nr:hypothetical protein [Candidatus Poribacteria bacterium]